MEQYDHEENEDADIRLDQLDPKEVSRLRAVYEKFNIEIGVRRIRMREVQQILEDIAIELKRKEPRLKLIERAVLDAHSKTSKGGLYD